MDPIKIGRFIAQTRKERSFTQRQLADRLGISDKTVSKWECGKGLPEVSLMLPLCEALSISVNELLSGQRLTDSAYKNKAEENMVDLVQEKEENCKKFILATITGILSLAAFLTILFVVVAYTDVIKGPVKIALVLIACGIFGVGLAVVMEGDRRIGYFQCAKCGEIFIPSFAAYVFGLHFLEKRRLKCPQCGAKSMCKKVLSKEK